MRRIFLAALLGAIAMFIWTSIAHMALPLGEAGIREIHNEAAVLDAMQQHRQAIQPVYLSRLRAGAESDPRTAERSNEAHG